jgi:hypothetical protein
VDQEDTNRNSWFLSKIQGGNFASGGEPALSMCHCTSATSYSSRRHDRLLIETRLQQDQVEIKHEKMTCQVYCSDYCQRWESDKGNCVCCDTPPYWDHAYDDDDGTATLGICAARVCQSLQLYSVTYGTPVGRIR